jgi:molecular chaperone GrpE
MSDPQRNELETGEVSQEKDESQVVTEAPETEQISEDDAVRLEVTELVEFLEDRQLRMRAYMADHSKSNDSEIKAIKEKCQSKLARDFIAVMKTLDDEVQAAAALNDEGSASLKSMAQGVAMINKAALQAVEGVNVSADEDDYSADETAKAAPKRKRRGMASMVQSAQKVSNPFTAIETVYERISSVNSKLEAASEELQAELKPALEEAKANIEKVVDTFEKSKGRVDVEKEKAAKYGAEKLVTKFAEVVDNMDRAIQAVDNSQTDVESDADLKRLYDGVKETKGLLLEVFAKHGITRDDPKGQKFDANKHQAVSTCPKQDGQDANTVAEVMAPGYLLHDRVVRSAMVLVAQ